MTPRHFAILSAVAATVVLVITVVTADGSRTPIVLATVGVVGVLAGLVAGLPAVTALGVGALVIGYSFAVGVDETETAVRLDVLIVAPALWLTFEAAARSFELRPSTRLSAGALIDWLLLGLVVVVGTVAAGFVILSVSTVGPVGGVEFRLGAIGGVVVTAGALAAANVIRTRPTSRARG